MTTRYNFYAFGIPTLAYFAYYYGVGATPLPNAALQHGPFHLSPPSAVASSHFHKKNISDLKKSSNSSAPAPRSDIIARMKSKYSDPSSPADILVIGGGAVGSMIALEAGARGLNVALAERRDFASGTSSKSTKLIHGGVRYLEKAFLHADPAQFSLVFEALRERNSLLSMAPHLTRELPTLVPCYSRLDLYWIWAGMKVYDLLAWMGGSELSASRLVSPREVQAWFPALKHTRPRVTEKDYGEVKDTKPDSLVGGVLYHDGQMDDSRMNVLAALTANSLGERVAAANYLEVQEFLFEGDGEGRRVIGARMHDCVANETFPVYARTTINATGPFCDSVRSLVNNTQEQQKNVIVASHGTHVSLPSSITLRGAAHGSGTTPALLVPKTSDGRVLFVAPWAGGSNKTYAGTTDRAGAILESPSPTKEDISFLLANVRDYFNVELDETAVSSAWCGIRPLAVPPTHSSSSSSSTQSIVREHIVFAEDGVTGFHSVAGGKWTTANRMACDALKPALADLAAHKRSEQENFATQPMSRYLKLLGGGSAAPVTAPPLRHSFTVSSTEILCVEALEKMMTKQRTPLSNTTDVARHLATSYGDRAFLVLELIREQQQHKKQQQQSAKPSSGGWFSSSSSSSPSASNNGDDLMSLLVPSLPILTAEVVYASRYEMAETTMDFLARRSRAAFMDVPALLANDAAAVRTVAALMGKEKKWSPQQIEAEVAKTTEGLKSEFMF